MLVVSRSRVRRRVTPAKGVQMQRAQQNRQQMKERDYVLWSWTLQNLQVRDSNRHLFF